MWTIGNVYRNREMILAHPEQYGPIITQFSAGGLGACLQARGQHLSIGAMLATHRVPVQVSQVRLRIQ